MKQEALDEVVASAQEYLRDQGLAGWLLYDYRGMNPIFRDTVGPLTHVTRPCWLWVPSEGCPRLLVSYVDQGRFSHLGLPVDLFVSREDMVNHLTALLPAGGRVAMEYTPMGALPRASRVDGGTLELVRSLGVEVVPSADLVQYATQRWSPAQLESHRQAAELLGRIVHEAFAYIGDLLDRGVTEHEVALFVRRRFRQEGLEVTDGPVVAVNEHSADPHFEPTPDNCVTIHPGDWVLIDLWGRLDREDAVFADITWVAYVGDEPPEEYRRVFETVIGARDTALGFLEDAFREGRPVQGWEVDRAAREFVEAAGYGRYFNHRLGHSLGREVHGNAVNLDDWETHDTRQVIPGVGVTIEPGIYLPHLGVRSEIDVYISPQGPEVTTQVQRSIVTIGPGQVD